MSFSLMFGVDFADSQAARLGLLRLSCIVVALRIAGSYTLSVPNSGEH